MRFPGGIRVHRGGAPAGGRRRTTGAMIVSGAGDVTAARTDRGGQVEMGMSTATTPGGRGGVPRAGTRTGGVPTRRARGRS